MAPLEKLNNFFMTKMVPGVPPFFTKFSKGAVNQKRMGNTVFQSMMMMSLELSRHIECITVPSAELSMRMFKHFDFPISDKSSVVVRLEDDAENAMKLIRQI